jgi:hypothetical protein
MPLLWGCRCCAKQPPVARSVPATHRSTAFHVPVKPSVAVLPPWHVECDTPDLCPIKARLHLVEMLWDASRPAAYYVNTGTAPPAEFDAGEAMQYLLSTGDVDHVAGRAIKTTFFVAGDGVTCKVISTFDRDEGVGAFARVLADWRRLEALARLLVF